MIKCFSTLRDIWRGSQNYMEKSKEGDKSDQGEKRGNQKERKKASQQSIPHIPSTVWTPQRCSLRKEEGGRRHRWPGGEKEESKGERQI